MNHRDSSAPVDAQARAEALDPERSFIVQAPAGSGKTSLLTERYLGLLARVEQPEEILAITFTVKAAGEMRRRIYSELTSALEGGPIQAPHEERARRLALAALEQDRRKGWGLTRHPLRLRIQTIDSLCASLVGQMPVLSGLGGDPGRSDQPQSIYEEAAIQVFQHLGSAQTERAEPLQRLLDHLDNNLGRAVRLLAEMLAHRDQWLRFIFRDNVTGTNLEKALAYPRKRALDKLNVDLTLPMRTTLVHLLSFASNYAPEGSPIAAWDEGEFFPTPEPKDEPSWLALSELLLTVSTRDFRKQFNIRQGFPPASKGGSPQEKALFGRMKKEAKAFVDSIRENEVLLEHLLTVQHLPPARFPKQQLHFIQDLFKVLQLAAAHLRALFAIRGETDYTEVSLAAVEALGDPDQPSDLALKLDYRINHILLDEFQDTSWTQYRLLERLTAGWSGLDGRTLFPAGDPMQSIY
ncbi:MAG: UvrD-helicase domain-containing protein, partial [Magnetococcales bacterium]|nr:UvrD-helicase domain-containing protein [Magnetococcales bacterium]